jgi:putative molybdopterin biosynthesis protein
LRQSQFLEVLDRDEAEARWHAALALGPLGGERVPISEALGRVLAVDLRTTVDVPFFDRSNMDGFAVRAADTFGASEERPVCLSLNTEVLATGVQPHTQVAAGTATAIATGGMVPRGADAVLPVELTDVDGQGGLLVRAPLVPGAAVSYAGTDMGAGETVLFAGTRLTARETGVLAAIGVAEVEVWRRPRVAVISTGDEIVAPGEEMRPGRVYDSNGRILCDSLRELGAEPSFLGCYRDEPQPLRRALRQGLEGFDVVILSGGTSKGEGDLCYRVVSELEPGILVHGVALKPGKPICLAAAGRTPVVILPGFPTSAVFTFHELVAPVIALLAGSPGRRRQTRRARMATAVRSERGRLEYLLVGLVADARDDLVAYPMGKGSGSVTSFSRADGFVRLERTVERVEEGAALDVTLLAPDVEPADLVIVGSHCVGLDLLAGELTRCGWRLKVLAVGSRAGLRAAVRGECDVAPVHLLDPGSDRYNEPFLEPGVGLVPGYARMQGVVMRASESRPVAEVVADASLRMVNRNRGSGTRILIDQLLGESRPEGYGYEPRSHHAVVAAVAQERADWGVAIEPVARAAGLRFEPLRAERYDFVVPDARRQRPAVRALIELLVEGSAARRSLAEMGFPTPTD